MSKLVVGLCEGRHDLPVSDYIFKTITDPSNVKEIEKSAFEWIEAHCDIGTGSGAGINQCGYTDVEIFQSSTELIIYVTGLTVALTSVLKFCMMNGIKTTLMNYDCKRGDYVEQKFL